MSNSTEVAGENIKNQAGSEFYSSINVSGQATIQNLHLGNNLTQNDIRPEKRGRDPSPPGARKNLGQRAKIEVDGYAKNTCQWLFSTPEYRKWAEAVPGRESIPILALQGKPGSGKSTLVWRVLEECQKPSPKNNLQKPLILEHFFSARNDTKLDQSSKGMYCGLFRQLCDQITPSPTTEDIKQTVEDFQHDENYIEIVQVKIYELLALVTEQRVILFLDAIDECRFIEPEKACRRNDAMWKVICFLEQLLQSDQAPHPALQICLSGRDLSMFKKRLSLESIIDVGAHNEGDIKIFLQSEIQKMNLKQALLEKLPRIMCQRASSMFLWARLAIEQLLCMNYHEMVPDSTVIEWIMEIPSELEDVYKRILNQMLDVKCNNVALPLFQLLQVAVRPLNLAEAQSALSQEDVFEDSHSDMDAMTNMSAESFEQFVRTTSGGLIEAWKDPHQEPSSMCSANEGERPRVLRFIHTSVRDFITAGGLKALATKLESQVDAHCHYQVARICMGILHGPEADHLASSDAPDSFTDAPFLKYAGTFWTLHARKADQVMCREPEIQSTIINCSDRSQNICKLFKLTRAEAAHHSLESVPMRVCLNKAYCENSMLVLLAFEGCGKLLEYHHRDCRNTEICYKSQDIMEAAFFLAVRRGWVAATTALWNLAQQHSIIIDVNMLHGQPPLNIACCSDEPGMIDFLLEKGADPLRKVSGSGDLPLHGVLGNGSLSVVETLLNPDRHYAEQLLEAKDDAGWTVLHTVAQRGHLQVYETVAKRLERLESHKLRHIILATTDGEESALQLATARLDAFRDRGGDAKQLLYSPQHRQHLKKLVNRLRNLTSRC